MGVFNGTITVLYELYTVFVLDLLGDMILEMFLSKNFKLLWLALKAPNKNCSRRPFIFSSPEQKVLMVSYCDQSLSVVNFLRCQLFALNDFFSKTARRILK